MSENKSNMARVVLSHAEKTKTGVILTFENGYSLFLDNGVVTVMSTLTVSYVQDGLRLVAELQRDENGNPSYVYKTLKQEEH